MVCPIVYSHNIIHLSESGSNGSNEQCCLYYNGQRYPNYVVLTWSSAPIDWNGGFGDKAIFTYIFCPHSAQILSKACNAGKEHKPFRYGCITLARVLMAHTEWLPGVWLRHFCTTLAVYIEDCEGWWLSSCHSSVAEYWLHKPGLLGWIPGNCHPFHFPLSCLNI